MVHKRILHLTLIVAALCSAAMAQSRTASAATANAAKVGRARAVSDSLNDSRKGGNPERDGSEPRVAVPGEGSQIDLQLFARAPGCPTAEKRRVYAEYGVNPKNHPPGEIDHFYPLCAGGSNDITSLWFQPATNVWSGKNYGYHEKDDLEAWMCQQIKANRLDPREAFDRLTTDWVKFYQEVKPGHQEEIVE
jgi:hypothetical protein